MVQNIGLSLVAVIFIVSLLAGLVFAGLFVRPITALAASANEIAQGDLSETITIERSDELGQLARAFVQMKDSLKALIQDVQENVQQLSAASEKLTASSEQSAQAAGDVSATATTMAEGVEKQHHSIDETATVIEQMSTKIQQIAADAKMVAAASETASQAAK